MLIFRYLYFWVFFIDAVVQYRIRMYLVALVCEIHQILKNGVSNVHWDEVLKASLFYLDSG